VLLKGLCVFCLSAHTILIMPNVVYSFTTTIHVLHDTASDVMITMNVMMMLSKKILVHLYTAHINKFTQIRMGFI